jgi:hypothetical protein
MDALLRDIKYSQGLIRELSYDGYEGFPLRRPGAYVIRRMGATR